MYEIFTGPTSLSGLGPSRGAPRRDCSRGAGGGDTGTTRRRPPRPSSTSSRGICSRRGRGSKSADEDSLKCRQSRRRGPRAFDTLRDVQRLRRGISVCLLIIQTDRRSCICHMSEQSRDEEDVVSVCSANAIFIGGVGSKVTQVPARLIERGVTDELHGLVTSGPARPPSSPMKARLMQLLLAAH